ncbi:DUF1631 family protein [Undibacterium sp. SXout20W]|uniref:DUF1631 family protein n=1 Tax=Undibacterium sp. SXout20W TaxID=3413051 RepID=UPI003BF076B5
MDPNELLPIIRMEFQKAFLASLAQALPQSIEALFKKAESTYSYTEQGQYLHACSLLRRTKELTDQMDLSMDALLTRSFQTTYNKFRPVSALSIKSSNLSLVDASVFDDELLLNEITEKFRIEAGDQIRDLNIRIAILFAQDNIKERENPFRPYLLARCIANTLEDLKLERDLCNILQTQIAEDFSQHVFKIYEAVNDSLASHGVAAELQFKLKKTNIATPGASDSNVGDEDAGTDNDLVATWSPSTFQRAQARVRSYRNGQKKPISGFAEIGGKIYDTAARDISSDQPKNRVEQLFDAVRHIASGIGGAIDRDQAAIAKNQAESQNFSEDIQAEVIANGISSVDQHGTLRDSEAMPRSTDATASTQFKWLAQHQSIGKVLRQVFSGSSLATTSRNTASHEQSVSSAEANEMPSDNPINEGETGTVDMRVDVDNALTSSHQAGQETAQQSTTPASGEFQEMPRYSGSGIVQSVQQLQRTHTAAAEQMFDQLGRIRNLILEQRAQLSDMTDDVDEQMTIDVVAMLFEFILSDNQVPAEIRAQLGRLQFLVLKIALRDQSLLTQKGHPARLLINRVGSISLGLKQIDPSGVHITKEICRIVETLLEDESETSQLFTRMLDEFDAFIARELRHSDKQTEETVEAVEEVQNRTLRIVHISAQLQAVLQKLTINPFLREFLENNWVSAIEMVERDDIRRGIRYRLLVPDLLWSIVPKAAGDDRTQLFALLPIILSTIREALALIQSDQEYQKTLLDWLVDAHTAALRTAQNNAAGRTLSLPSIHQHFQPFVYPADTPHEQLLNDADKPEIQKILDKAIRELDLQVEMLDQICDQELAAESDPPTAKSAFNSMNVTPEIIKERLRTGVSLELHLGFKPSAGKLSWVDPQLRNLVLRLEGHDKPSLVSVRMFRRMIAHGRVRFLEAEPLFERAVQALLTSADVLDQPEMA